MKEIKLVCKKFTFYSRLDEDMFFKRIKKNKCILDIKGINDELYLYIDRNKVEEENNLRELLSLFHRYWY
jgi:hypothetical protein